MKNNVQNIKAEQMVVAKQVDINNFKTSGELITAYQSLKNTMTSTAVTLPSWAIEAAFNHHANLPACDNSGGVGVPHLLSQYFIVHRAAALDIYFDGIICNNVKTAEYLIYEQARS